MERSHGARISKFIRTFLTLNGSFAGEPFTPLDWVDEMLEDMFSINPDNQRRYRTFLLSIARKNAKSTIGAAVAIYMLVADQSENAPLVISAAGDRAQARMVYAIAKDMILSSPELSAVCEVFANEIRCTLNGGVYRVVSADAGRAHGLNPSCVVADELHVWPNDDLYVALNTGSAARRQPLTIILSTPGHTMDTPFGRLVEYGRRVTAGEIEDDSFGMREFGPPEEFDPMDPEVWEACNPSWEFMNAKEMETNSKQMPLNDFIRYRLGGWVSSQSAWLPNGCWEGLKSDKQLQPDDLIMLGLDGSWKGDSTALVGVRMSDLHMEVLGHWEQDIDDPHWRVPLADVEETTREALERFTVRELVADPYRIEKLLQDLAADGFPVVEFPTNSVKRISPATEAFYIACVNGDISHGGDPAFKRHIDNAVLKTDARGARITKNHASSTNHIDIVIAALIAFHRAYLYRDEETQPEPQLLII